MQLIDISNSSISMKMIHITLPVQSQGRKVGQMRIGEATRVENPLPQLFCKHQNSRLVPLKSKKKDKREHFHFPPQKLEEKFEKA